MKLYTKYNLSNDVDFINVELNSDNQIWIDPMMIHMDKSELGIECCEIIREYFSKLLNCALTNDDNKAYELYKYFREMNETRLGYSQSGPRGISGGTFLGKQIFTLIKNSTAVNSLLIGDIFDGCVVIEKLGIDKISDFISSLIFEKLISYTQNQCKKYGIPMIKTKVKNKYWSQNRNKWINEKEYLPIDEESNLPIVFIPKKFVESKLVFSHKRFYNEAMIPYLGEDAVRNRLEGLIQILKNNTIKPKKTAIRKKYPCKKEVVNDFIKQNNEVYKNYKKKELKYLNYNNYK